MFITAKEAAKLTGGILTYKSILWHLARGNIPAGQPGGPGGKYLLDKEAFLRWLEGRNDPPPAAVPKRKPKRPPGRGGIHPLDLW